MAPRGGTKNLLRDVAACSVWHRAGAHYTGFVTNSDDVTRGTSPLASQGGAPVRKDYLPIAVPWIGEREKQLVLDALESGWITTGPKTQELARRIAAMAGVKHAVAVNSATGALHLALEALDVGPSTR